MLVIFIINMAAEYDFATDADYLSVKKELEA